LVVTVTLGVEAAALVVTLGVEAAALIVALLSVTLVTFAAASVGALVLAGLDIRAEDLARETCVNEFYKIPILKMRVLPPTQKTHRPHCTQTQLHILCVGRLLFSLRVIQCMIWHLC